MHECDSLYRYTGLHECDSVYRYNGMHECESVCRHYGPYKYDTLHVGLCTFWSVCCKLAGFVLLA